MKVAILTLFVCLIPATAHADILYLENGGRVEGVVTGGPESFVVRSIHGTTKIPANRVLRRVKVPYITEVFASKRKRVDARDPDALFALLLWCEREGLRRELEPLVRAILELDPDHGPTRNRQGLVKYGGLWMTPERAHDLRMTKDGFVRYDDRWFTPAGLTAYIRAKQESARLAELVAKKREERAARERKIRDEEAAKKREEERRRQADEDRDERRRLQRKNDELVDLLRAMHLRDAYYDRYRLRGGYYLGFSGGWGGWGGSGCYPPIARPHHGGIGYRGYGSCGSLRPSIGTGYRSTGTYTVSPIGTRRR